MSEQVFTLHKSSVPGVGRSRGTWVYIFLRVQEMRGHLFLLRNGSLSQGNKEVIGTNCKLCSAQSAVTESAVYELELLKETTPAVRAEWHSQVY